MSALPHGSCGATLLLLLLLLLAALPLLTLLRLTLLLAAVTATRHLSAADEPVCNGESDLRAVATETRQRTIGRNGDAALPGKPSTRPLHCMCRPYRV